MKADIVLALAEAHYNRDEQRFKGLLQQAAVHSRNLGVSESLQKLVAMPVLMSADQLTITEPVKAVKRGDLILESELAAELDTIAAEHHASTALIAAGLDARRRLLFTGPPGNGKTSAAAMLGGMIGVSCYTVSLPALVGSLKGETAARLAKLFPALGQGVCLVLDEIDAIGASRSASDSSAGHEFNHTVNSLLSLLDRTTGGLLVATTNRPEFLDSALLRRFDETLEFRAPSSRAKRELAVKLCARFGVRASEVNTEQAASFDEVEKRCRAYARRVVLENAARPGGATESA